MSASLRVWIAAVTASCAVAVVAVESVSSGNEPCTFGVCPGADFPDVRIRQNVSEAHKAAMWAFWREATDAALAARVLPATKATVGDATVWFAPDVSEKARRNVQRKFDAERTARGAWHGHGAVAVLVVADTGKTFDGVPAYRRNPTLTTRALLPSSATGGRCVSIVRLGTTMLAGTELSPSVSLLDACGFDDAFGAPGKAIAAALDSGRYAEARTYLPGLPDTLRRRRAGADLIGNLATPPTGVVLCLTGADSACAAFVSHLIARTPRTVGDYYGTVPRTPGPFAVEKYQPDESSFLDLVALDLGPERFARFWRSDEPFTAAYGSAAGVPITDLIRRVAGAELRNDFRSTGFGMRATNRASATIGSSALILLAVALLYALAAYRAPRARAA